MIDYDTLHDYLDAKQEDELAAVNEYQMDENHELAAAHAARAEAFREAIFYIEYKMEFG